MATSADGTPSDPPLEAWRKAFGVKKAEFARICGLRRQKLHQLNTGEHALSYEKRVEITRAINGKYPLDLLPDDLLLNPTSAMRLKLSQISASPPTGDAVSRETDTVKSVLRPIVRTLVQQYGFEAVVREAATVSKEETEQAHPHQRRRTS